MDNATWSTVQENSIGLCGMRSRFVWLFLFDVPDFIFLKMGCRCWFFFSKLTMNQKPQRQIFLERRFARNKNGKQIQIVWMCTSPAKPHTLNMTGPKSISNTQRLTVTNPRTCSFSLCFVPCFSCQVEFLREIYHLVALFALMSLVKKTCHRTDPGIHQKCVNFMVREGRRLTHTKGCGF